MPLPFDTFVFTNRELKGRTARLAYRLVGRGGDREFEETFDLPFDLERSAADPADVAAALAGLHLIAGVSYWKTCCPARIELEQDGLGATEAAFWTEVYNRGLAELFYRNGFEPAGRALFPGRGEPAAAAGQDAEGPALVLAGGGKDSVVAYEIASAANGDGQPTPLTVVPAGRNWQLAPNREGRGLQVVRRLDPRVFELNAAGAYNGHVPFSAILAFAAQLAAVVGGFGEVIAANERSASSGNLEAGGVEVNHQWSKGLRFEELFQNWQRSHLKRVPLYFSLLRPLGELRIAQIFASFPRWFGAVTSCNANFRQQGGDSVRWCGRCAKCIFAGIVLAPWLDAAGVAAVFGISPLADPDNLQMVRQLLGIDGHKPWDCVGTPGEVAAALWLACQRHPRSSLPALRWFQETIAAGFEVPEEQVRRELEPSPVHLLPGRWNRALADALAAR
ncbi:MAG TPA: hypothetical protein VN970_09405 [Thermoanaerobaculia bacterium]|nr:hypothetical protein [Thermoanaerobaculia bacterium]